jgi:NADH-quinone oxidoreductase subunit A
MQGQYLGILVLICLAALICSVMVIGSWLLGPKKVTPYKQSPYECGVAPEGNARERFPIKFYVVAILFILFDIEVVFLWPWMSIYASSDRAFKVFSYIELLLYMTTWVLGYAYAIRVNAMDWDETTSLDPAKLGEGTEPDAIREAAPSAVPVGAR